MNPLLLLDLLRRTYNHSAYDPISGVGGIEPRQKVKAPNGDIAFVPTSMLSDKDYTDDIGISEWRKLRCKHDFEYWCAACVTIKDKQSGENVNFVLNAPQRRIVALLEKDRRAKKPIRLIMLKARQWGGSTLIQMYMAWIQTCHRHNWHSLICAHVKNISSSILGMYSKVLANYPVDMWSGEGTPSFRPFERSHNTRCIEGTGCNVTIASAESYESIRGADYAMAHLSEAAFWPATPGKSPAGLIRAVCGAIAMEPDTLIAIESTANGVGNFFHSEWLRSRSGDSDKTAIFVPWYEIEMYRLEPPEPELLLSTLSPYENMLWHYGLALDQIWWYRCKLREYASHDQMQAEYPTTDVEAFATTGSSVFAPEQVEKLRKNCIPPAMTGDISANAEHFIAEEKGRLHIWELPCDEAQYIAAVDVGGRSHKSDWSVIVVMAIAETPRVVAQWRGHIDHDLLAVEAERIARFYNNALLVIESNTYETEEYSGGADTNLFILSRLADSYHNVYRRRAFDRLRGVERDLIGFHTNRATKAMLISNLIEQVREGHYIERCNDACDELIVYRQQPNGSYAAADGKHDDILMTRAIALLIIKTEALSATPIHMPTQHSW